MKNESNVHKGYQRIFESRHDECREENSAWTVFPHGGEKALGLASGAGAHQRAFRPAFLFRLVTCIAFLSLTARG